MNDAPLFESARSQAQYEAMLNLLGPGERVDYYELLSRMTVAGHDTCGIGITLDALAFRGWTNLWRLSKVVSYREPYFDHEVEGNWTEGALCITRAEEAAA